MKSREEKMKKQFIGISNEDEKKRLMSELEASDSAWKKQVF